MTQVHATEEALAETIGPTGFAFHGQADLLRFKKPIR